jgi:hypothetical protein
MKHVSGPEVYSFFPHTNALHFEFSLQALQQLAACMVESAIELKSTFNLAGRRDTVEARIGPLL